MWTPSSRTSATRWAERERSGSNPREGPEPLPFVLTDGVLPRWRYSPPDYARPPVETVFFDAPAPSPEEPPALRGWQAEG